LHRELSEYDPAAATRIRPADGQRIQRALEVLEITGRPLSELQSQTLPSAFAFATFVLSPFERPELYARLDDRFLGMVRGGLVEEVGALYRRGDLNADLPSLRAVGYRQVWRHVAGEYSLEEAVRAGQRATRQLARRQLTWLRTEIGAQWVRSVADQELVMISPVFAQVAGCGTRGTVC
jgi:tRNA dimethylallyltransferase